MDPNEALRLARKASEQFGKDITADQAAAAGVDLMMYFDALDQWLTNGGFLPEAWERKGKPEAKPSSQFTGRRNVSPRGF